MPETGKVDHEFFRNYIAPRLGATRSDVQIGPTHGVDFGTVQVDDSVLVVATDPISILPELGFARAGWYAIQFALSDVAVSGLAPSHLALSFSLPPELTDEQFDRLWGAIHDECRDLGVAIVTGHTARYDGCQFPWVGGATAFALGDPDEIVTPAGANPGDYVLITKGPAVETTGLLTTLFPEKIPVEQPILERAQRLLDETDVVRDALTASAAGGVTAMHDATEGGLLGGLFELSSAAGVKLDIDSERVPTMAGVEDVCDALDMDPWTAGTGATLLITVEPKSVDAVVRALEDRETPVGVAGRVESGEGVLLDGVQQSPPDGDSSWPVYERLLEN